MYNVHKHFSKSIWNCKCSQLQLIYFFVYIALSHFGFFYIYHRIVSLHHSCSSFHLNVMILWHNEWLRCFKIELIRSQNHLHIIYLYDRTSTLWLNWRKKYKLSFKLREIGAVWFFHSFAISMHAFLYSYLSVENDIFNPIGLHLVHSFELFFLFFRLSTLTLFLLFYWKYCLTFRYIRN